jgi:hypothetical protein
MENVDQKMFFRMYIMSEQKMKEWLETPMYKDDNGRQINAYVRYIFLGFVIFSPLFVLAHELGHAVVGNFFGWKIKEFVVNYDSGYILFDYNKILMTQYVPSVLVYVAGGIFASGLIYILSGLYKPAIVMIWAYLPYGLWEGMRGALLALEVSNAVYYPFMQLVGPISNIGMAIMMISIVYQSFKILYQKPLGSME